MANTTDNLMIKVTDQTPEPPAGSVIMRHGWKGTAYQRHFFDGLWYPMASGRRKILALSWTTITSRAKGGEEIFVVYHCEEGA